MMEYQITLVIERPGMSQRQLEDEAADVCDWLDTDKAAQVKGACVAGTFDPPQLEIDMTVDAQSLNDLLKQLVGGPG